MILPHKTFLIVYRQVFLQSFLGADVSPHPLGRGKVSGHPPSQLESRDSAPKFVLSRCLSPCRILFRSVQCIRVRPLSVSNPGHESPPHGGSCCQPQPLLLTSWSPRAPRGPYRMNPSWLSPPDLDSSFHNTHMECRIFSKTAFFH